MDDERTLLVPIKNPQKDDCDEPWNSLTARRKLTSKDYVCIAMLCFINFCHGIAYGLIASFYPLEAKQKGLTFTEVGVVISALPLAMIAFGLLISQLLLKVRVRTVLLVTLTMVAAAVFPFAFVMKIPSEPIFLVVCTLSRCIQGIGFVAGQLSAVFIFSTSYQDRISTVMGFLEMAMASGISAGPAIGGFIYTALGFEAPLFFLGSLIAMSTVLAYFLFHPADSSLAAKKTLHRHESMISPSESFVLTSKTIFKVPGLLLPLSTCIVMYMNVSIFDVTLSPFIAETFDQTAAIIGVVFLVGVGSYALFSPILGYILDRKNHNSLAIIVGCFLAVLSTLFIGPVPYFHIDPNIFLTAGCFVLVQISGSLMYVPVLGLCFDIMKDYNVEDNEESRGFVNTSFILAGNIGNFIGPLLGGILIDAIGFPKSGLVLGTITAGHGVTLVVFSMYRQARKREM